MKKIILLSFVSILLLVPSTFSQNVKNELDAYNSAKKENKITTYKSFMKQFPNSDNFYEIDTLCSNLGLKYADSLKTIPGYLTFLDSFPSSIYSIDVVHKILVLAVPNFSSLTKLADANKAIATIKQLNDQNNFGFAFDRLNHFSEVGLESGTWTNINLNVSHFANGDSIPEAKTNQEWMQAANDKKPAWCYYDNDPENGSKYGKLYNLYAISDPRGLSTSKHNLPTYEDYLNLVNESGGLSNAGKQLKCPSEWEEQRLEEDGELNINGFNALPVGYRDYQGNFVKKGEFAVFWTGEGGGNTNSYVILYKNYNNVNLFPSSTAGNGYSVRLKSYFEDSDYSYSNVLDQLFLKRDELLLKEYGLIKDWQKVAPFLFNQIKSELGVKHLKKEEINEAHFQFILDRFYKNDEIVKNGIFLVPPYFYDYIYCGNGDGAEGGSDTNPPILNGFKNGVLNYIKYENGDSYTGETSDDSPNGKGTIKWINGDSYTGEFSDGYPNGKGTIKWKNGVSYTGDVSYGEPNGKGTKTFPNGTKETGDFIDGEYKKPFQCKTATIGNQVWMAENLKIITFRNGDPIPEVKTASEWEIAGEKRQAVFCYVNNDPSTVSKYGVLYNWYAVNDKRGLAPEGWRIPTEEDFKQLINYASSEIIQNEKNGEYLSSQGVSTSENNKQWTKMHQRVKTNKGLSTPSPYFAGTKLKSKSGWEVNQTLHWDGNGTDNYGFNAKSSFERSSFGDFNSYNRISYWTSSIVNNGDQYSGNSCGIYVNYCGVALTIKDGFGSAEEENAEVSIGNLGDGYNVRLIK